MAKIKYLGTADVRKISKGENWSGRLAEGIPQDIQFDSTNNFIVDSDEVGLSPEALELLLEDNESFKDVTNLKRVPSSMNERLFAGHKASDAADEVLDVEHEVPTQQVGAGDTTAEAPVDGPVASPAPEGVQPEGATRTTGSGRGGRGTTTGGSTATT